MKGTINSANRYAILDMDSVRHWELSQHIGNTHDDVNDARKLIQSDPYFNQGLTSWWIGLLNTGVNRAYVLLNSANRITFRRGCTSGELNCIGGKSDNSCWIHGASAAGIISGDKTAHYG